MLKKIFSPLTLCVAGGLLLLACGSSETSNNTATTNANRATTNTTAPATNTATTNTAGANTASAEKVGVPECDDYITKYEACVSGKVPETARAQYNASIAQMRKSWHDLAANPQTKGSLAQACKTATESAKTAMKSFGCAF
ncbi:MAG: hypothetical protein ACJ741_20020 [Pyrinomonadaceae bacterium]